MEAEAKKIFETALAKGMKLVYSTDAIWGDESSRVLRETVFSLMGSSGEFRTIKHVKDVLRFSAVPFDLDSVDELDDHLEAMFPKAIREAPVGTPEHLVVSVLCFFTTENPYPGKG